MLSGGLEKFALNWGAIGQGAMRGAVPAAALGAVGGALLPGQDAEGHRRSRLSGALHTGLGAGVTGGLLGGALGATAASPAPAAPTARSLHYQATPDPGYWPRPDVRPPRAPVAPAQLMGHANDMPDLSAMKRGFDEGVKAAALKFGIR